jgi:hypothetical protein
MTSNLDNGKKPNEGATLKVAEAEQRDVNMYKTVSEQFGKPQMSRAGTADKKSKDVYV